jgi:acylphosphatase
MKVRAHVLISGKVQGVFFRAKVCEMAVKSDVKGWVRNLEEDEVETVFEGEKEDVNKVIEFCKRGPVGAKVVSFEICWEEFRDEFKDFKIIYR